MGDHPNLEHAPTKEERKLMEMEGGNGINDNSPWFLQDMQIPQGIKCKLIRIPDPEGEEFRISEVGDRLKFIDPTPVLVLSGAMNQERDSSTMAGICRGAFNTKCTILDCGMASN